MLDGIAPLSSLERAVGVRRPAARPEPVQAPAVKEGLLDPFPSSPPPEVLKDLDHAQGVIADLASRQLNLEFEVDKGSNRIRVTVRDESGKVIREVPARHALDLLSGERSTLAVDAVG
ncbi:MAG: flagellar protein FlaG [Gaiella sp.]